MKTILTWEDAEEFKGKFVAYESSSCYFSPCDNRFNIDNVNFAYVNSMVNPWNSGETGGSMENFLLPTSVPSNYALIPSTLKNASMKMREASIEEIQLLKKAVECDKAKMSYTSTETVNAIFNRVLEK